MTVCSLGGTKIKINALMLACIAISVFAGGAAELTASLAALALHEAAHSLCAKIMHKQVESIELFPFGASASIRGIEDDFSCAVLIPAAGPLFSFACFAVLSRIPSAACAGIARYSFLIGAFNLLPVFPLDGGRIICAAAESLFSAKAARAVKLAGTVLSAMLCLVGVWQIITRQAATITVMSVFLLCSSVKALKTPENLLKKLCSTENAQEGEIICVGESETCLDTVKRMKKGKYSVILVRDAAGDIIKVLSQKQITDALFEDAASTVKKIKQKL